jgi:hypothetical protein
MGITRLGRGLLRFTASENYLERLRKTTKHPYTANLHHLEHTDADEGMQLKFTSIFKKQFQTARDGLTL